MKLFVDFWKFTYIWKGSGLLDVQNNFMFPTCKKSQKLVKKDKHSSFDGLIQEDIDLSDIYLAVN